MTNTEKMTKTIADQAQEIDRIINNSDTTMQKMLAVVDVHELILKGYHLIVE